MSFLLCITDSAASPTPTPPLLQDPEQLQESGNQILTAIIQGMRKEEASNNVKLAATNALLNSLEFTKANFDKEVWEDTHTNLYTPMLDHSKGSTL